MVWQFTFLGNVELAWDEPTNAVWFEQMASGTRLILPRPEGTVEQTICVADAVTTAHLLDDVITTVQLRPTRSGPAAR